MLRLQENPFDPGTELTTFTKGADGAGAVVSFTGIVRDDRGNLDRMEIEHYPGMAEKAIGAMIDTAVGQWALTDCLVIHRFGSLRSGEVIMMVATAAHHRGDAFQAASFLMDFLKSRAPFWKKEISRDGAVWVEAREDDETALSRW